MVEKRIVPLLAGVLLLASCSSAPKTDFKLLRFIDLLTEKNVVSSPFASGRFDFKNDLFFHDKNRLISDRGSGGNPYRLKRKMVFQSTNLNALVAPPGTKFVFDVDLPPDAVLEFGAGIVRGENSEAVRVRLNPPPGKVLFLIKLESAGRKKSIFSESVDLPPLKDLRASKLVSKRIPLPPAGGKARLTFVTEGPEGTFSFWADPIVYASGPGTRKIILISIDTLRADHLGCYGYDKPTSPNIDALAGDGALFLNPYAPSPWTLPSHVSLLTALTCFRHGVNAADIQMDGSLTTLADLLRSNGFYCGAFTGGGFVSPVYGFSKGFDMYKESEGSLEFLDSAARISDSAVQWIENNKDKDFFLFIHTYQTHMPYTPPAPYDTMFLDSDYLWKMIDLAPLVGDNREIYKKVTDRERRNVIGLYDGEIRYTDEALIGRLTAKLKSLDLYDDTLIVLTSDHGEEFYDHGSWLHSHALYDESLKVPLIVKFPGSKYRGRKAQPLVRLIDVMPTVLDAFGISTEMFGFDGRSLIPVLRGRDRKNRSLLAYLAKGVLNSPVPEKTAMTFERTKVILNSPFLETDLARFAYPPPPCQEVEVYDLAADPLERHNIALAKAALASRFAGAMKELLGKERNRRGAAVTMDREVEEKLRALGYIH